MAHWTCPSAPKAIVENEWRLPEWTTSALTQRRRADSGSPSQRHAGSSSERRCSIPFRPQRLVQCAEPTIRHASLGVRDKWHGRFPGPRPSAPAPSANAGLDRCADRSRRHPRRYRPRLPRRPCDQPRRSTVALHEQMRTAVADYFRLLVVSVAELRDLPPRKEPNALDKAVDKLRGEQGAWIARRRAGYRLTGDRYRQIASQLAVAATKLQTLPLPPDVRAPSTRATTISSVSERTGHRS